MSKVGEKIKKARLRAGISQYRLSKISGIAQATISAIEAEGQTRSPATDTVEKIADALGVTVSELLDDGMRPDALAPQEIQLLDFIRQLNADGVSRVLDYARDLIASGNYKKMPAVSAG